MARRTVSLPENVDRTIRSISERRGDSYSATVARLVEEGARRTKERPMPDWIGSADFGPRDFARHYERYMQEAFDLLDKKYRARRRAGRR
jgi:hypothetical protein